MSIFKPVAINHTIELKMDDVQNALAPTVVQIKQTLKTVGIALAIAVPSLIVLAFVAHVGSEVAIDRLTTPTE